jgi:aryl-alcohol dehydrogenase-like predicted oxidoreductase
MTAEVGIGTRALVHEGVEAAAATVDAAVAAGVTLIEFEVADQRAIEAIAGTVARSRSQLLLVALGDAEPGVARAALERLGIDRFDCYLANGADADTSAAQVLALDGLTRVAGLATDSPERALAAVLEGGVDLVQMPFHALDRSLLDGASAVLNAARAADVAVLGCSPLAGGRLLTPATEEALSFLTDGPPRTVAEGLVAWALSEPRLNAVITGPRTPAHAFDAAEASRHAPLPDDVIQRLIATPSPL